MINRPNHAMKRTADRCAINFCDEFHTFTARDARSRPPSLILLMQSLCSFTLRAPSMSRLGSPFHSR